MTRRLLAALLAASLLTFGTVPTVNAAVTSNWWSGTWSTEAELDLFVLLDAEHFRRCGNHLRLANYRLRHVARWKAADMALHNDLDHEDALGLTTFDLFRRAGGTYSVYGEVIAYNNWPLDATVRVTFDGWMDSAIHRPIVVSCTWTRVGVGAFRVGLRKWYAAEYIKP